MVRARLTAINGTSPTRAGQLPTEARASSLEREANLTWAATLQTDNRIVAGEWWRAAMAAVRVSRSRASTPETLGLKLGDTLTYDVAGETDRRARREPARGAVGHVPAELLHGVLARRARRRHRHVDHERAHRDRDSGGAGRTRAAVSGGDGHRHRRDAGAGARRHGQGVARRAVRFPVHACGGYHGAARGHAVDARRASLRKRDAAHARARAGVSCSRASLRSSSCSACWRDCSRRSVRRPPAGCSRARYST